MTTTTKKMMLHPYNYQQMEDVCQMYMLNRVLTFCLVDKKDLVP